MSIQAPSVLFDGRPTGVVSVRRAVCDASRAVIGYEVLTGDPEAPRASARLCALEGALLDGRKSTWCGDLRTTAVHKSPRV